MSKTLVAFFSAGGVTAGVARVLADALDAPLHEIVPQIPYTPADLDWRNAASRSSVEMRDKASRPAIAAASLPDFDTLLLGFPIWWYVAPTIVNTFLEQHDFAGKRIILFATSGGSGFGETAAHLAGSADPTARIEEGLLQRGRQDMDAWRTWARGLSL